MLYSLYACVIGFLLDLLLGDPQWFSLHPIRLIGKLITLGERIFRKIAGNSKQALLVAGMLLAFLVAGISFFIPLVILFFCSKVSPILQIAVESVMCYFLFATKSLKTESMKVYQELEKKDLQGARKAVSMIVGRDVEQLDETGVAKAAVETVAENTSDGVVAPILFAIIGGAPLGFFYKAVNTMDSMIGYKNEKYMFFGRFAARLDDVVNFIPARFSAWIMLFVAYLLPGMNGKKAAQIYGRDRKNSSSPNAGQTEAVCAGALQIEILGPAYYFGKLYEKPTIGDNIEPVTPEKIVQVNRLMFFTAVVSLLLLAGIKYGVCVNI